MKTLNLRNVVSSIAMLALAGVASSAHAQAGSINSVDQFINNAGRVPQAASSRTAATSPTPPTFGPRGGGDQRTNPVKKPFAAVIARPTVSPYLNLTNGNGNLPAVGRYQTLVRPAIDQQRFNQQQSQNINQLQQQVQDLQGTVGVDPSGNAELRSTGHAAVFGNTFNYFGGR